MTRSWMKRLPLLSLVGLLSPVVPATALVPAESARAQTVITLEVIGCDSCRVQAVQSDQIGNITYGSKTTRVRNGLVTLAVPTAKTADMSFLVTVPFDDYGLPLVAVVGFRSKSTGEGVKRAYVKTQRAASSCWAGTGEPTVTNTLVVTKRPGALAYGEGHGTVAGAYLKTTLTALPPYVRVRNAAFHLSEATMCYDPSRN